MDILHSLVYVSSATRPVSSEDLDAILDVSRRRNAENAISGALLYADGNFMQLLEGPRHSVDLTMARIRRSSYHDGIIVLNDEPTSVREFDGWSMGFKRLETPEFLALRSASWIREDDRLTQGRELLRDFWRNAGGRL